MMGLSSLSDLAQWIRARRKQLGWSQQELANRAGISRNYLSLIERAQATNVSMRITGDLQRVLGESPKEVQVTLQKKVWIDWEIAAEIVFLNSQGVWMEGCCAGHGDHPPEAVIVPSSCTRARALGYEPVYLGDEKGLFKILLKSQVGTPERKDVPIAYCPSCALNQPVSCTSNRHYTVRCSECKSVIKSGVEGITSGAV